MKEKYSTPQIFVEEFELGDNSLGNLCSSFAFIFTEDGIFGKSNSGNSLFE